MFNFGTYNFVNAFVHPDGILLYVQVKSFTHTEDPYHCKHYACTTTDEEGRKFIVYTFPEKWLHTFQKFKDGKYSEFTKLAKATIIQYCGLHWKHPTDRGQILSDARLLAMYKRESLKVLLAEQLSIDPQILDGNELVSPPKLSEFLILPSVV
jgi:hypothetical protein